MRIEVTQDYVGIGQCRLLASLVIARRTGSGSSALRPDLQGTTTVEPGNAAPAGPYFGDVHGRHAQCIATALEQPMPDVHATAHLVLRRACQLSVFDERRLGSGAANVQRD